MKTLTLLALATAATIPALGAAQSYGPPVLSLKIANALINPGFENNSLAPWTQTGQSFPDNAVVAPNPTPAGALGYRRSGGHSGGYCYDFGVGYYDHPVFADHYGVLHQDLPSPMSGSAIFGASAWVKAIVQGISVQINYDDGTSSTATFYGGNTPQGDDTGWRQWDFSKAIDTGKTVKSLDFRVFANWKVPYDVLLDDVFIGKLVPVGK